MTDQNGSGRLSKSAMTARTVFILATLLAVSGASLYQRIKESEEKHSTLLYPDARHYKDFDAVSFNDPEGRKLILTEPYLKGGNLNAPRVTAFDSRGNGLGRIDLINLENVPNGHFLEGYASLETLQRVYDDFWPTNSIGGRK